VDEQPASGSASARAIAAAMPYRTGLMIMTVPFLPKGRCGAVIATELGGSARHCTLVDCT
jgi:hypothetical protein